MKKYKDASFLELTFRFTTIFFFVVVLFRLLFAIISNGYDAMYSTYLAGDLWQYNLRRYILLALIYGVFMAGYYKFIKKE